MNDIQKFKIAVICSCESFDVSKDDLLGESRKMIIKLARGCAIYIAFGDYKETKERPTLVEIAHLFGRNNHATIAHNIQSVKDWIDSKDPIFYPRYCKAQKMFDIVYTYEKIKHILDNDNLII